MSKSSANFMNSGRVCFCCKSKYAFLMSNSLFSMLKLLKEGL